MSCDNKLITDEEKVVSWLWISFLWFNNLHWGSNSNGQPFQTRIARISPCQQSLSFACSVLASSRNNTLHESSKMYVEHARHVASNRTQSGSPYTRVLSTAGSVMTISLSINTMLALGKKKRQFEGRKQDWLVQKFVLRRPQRFNVIQAEPLFLFLNQQGSAQRVLEE